MASSCVFAVKFYSACSCSTIPKPVVTFGAGYSALFYEMCTRMDIMCEIVNGYARGYLWKDTDNVEESNHGWNAVLIDDA